MRRAHIANCCLCLRQWHTEYFAQFAAHLILVQVCGTMQYCAHATVWARWQRAEDQQPA